MIVILNLFLLTLVLSKVITGQASLEQEVKAEFDALEDLVFYPIINGQDQLGKTFQATVTAINDYHSALLDYIEIAADNVTSIIGQVAGTYSENNVIVSSCLEEGVVEENRAEAIAALKDYEVSTVRTAKSVLDNATSVLQLVIIRMFDIKSRYENCLRLQDGVEECLGRSLAEIELHQQFLLQTIQPIIQQNTLLLEKLSAGAQGSLSVAAYRLTSENSYVLDEFLKCALDSIGRP